MEGRRGWREGGRGVMHEVQRRETVALTMEWNQSSQTEHWIISSSSSYKEAELSHHITQQ